MFDPGSQPLKLLQARSDDTLRRPAAVGAQVLLELTADPLYEPKRVLLGAELLLHALRVEGGGVVGQGGWLRGGCGGGRSSAP